MPKYKRGDDRTDGDPIKPLAERTGARSSPGSGEDDDDEYEDEDDQAADLQPEDVENDDPAR